ncbi:hypothetical protein AKJ66_02640 [candidate division MSBL1 archaeon SCGC-AAA259E22]|uniref:Uncharacterized protein n=1 Tax=candidate division MSBL1 archaeon SCGC-AAA259E22 TaxID=1698265 RepID=A0A133UGB7_9EURY|nr:hypothetical protein AKJ66_02640 [candidate division MSBL1 archaeon SCGC-AAA259E22]
MILILLFFRYSKKLERNRKKISLVAQGVLEELFFTKGKLQGGYRNRGVSEGKIRIFKDE